MAKPSKLRYVLWPLAFIMTFLAGSSAGYVYIANKQMRVDCNFNLMASPQQRFGT